MKALVKRDRKPGLWLEEVPEPQIGINDLLIRVDRTGICGTDLHIYKWDEWAQRTIPVPMVVGHEFVGRVEKVGSNVADFKIGDLVSAEGHVVCGRCRNCLAGRRHLCKDTQGIGVNRPGAFAELISVPVTNVWHHDDNIDLDVASIFDPFGNAVHTALSFGVLGEDVLVTGAGPIGIMSAAIARHVGARNIVISDVNDYRLALAAKMGATRTVNVKRETIADAMRELGMVGFDVGLEMSGNGEAFETMLESMYNGGRIALLGIAPGPVRIDWDEVVFRGLTIKGIYGREIWETWYKMQTMLQSGLDIAPVITHELPFAEYEAGFEAMMSGNSGKVVLQVSPEGDSGECAGG
jgi:threonine 3-dehydrogenase